jgi:hypothetical protein
MMKSDPLMNTIRMSYILIYFIYHFTNILFYILFLNMKIKKQHEYAWYFTTLNYKCESLHFNDLESPLKASIFFLSAQVL